MLTKQVWHKRLGCCDVILGINISRTSNRLILSQSHYVMKVLKKNLVCFFIKNQINKKCSPL
jgi:hypothetical protein